MLDIVIACPHCGEENHIVEEGAPDSIEVTCSFCQRIMGKLGDLVRAEAQRRFGPKGNDVA